MIKDLYTANGELIGTAIWHKKNATVSVVYLEGVMREQAKKIKYSSWFNKGRY